MPELCRTAGPRRRCRCGRWNNRGAAAGRGGAVPVAEQQLHSCDTIRIRSVWYWRDITNVCMLGAVQRAMAWGAAGAHTIACWEAGQVDLAVLVGLKGRAPTA